MLVSQRKWMWPLRRRAPTAPEPRAPAGCGVVAGRQRGRRTLREGRKRRRSRRRAHRKRGHGRPGGSVVQETATRWGGTPAGGSLVLAPGARRAAPRGGVHAGVLARAPGVRLRLLLGPRGLARASPRPRPRAWRQAPSTTTPEPPSPPSPRSVDDGRAAPTSQRCPDSTGGCPLLDRRPRFILNG